MVSFKKATRTQKKLRCALLGPAGAGKTRTALEIAKGIGEKIALIDTEHGSASMYAHIVGFDALELMSFSPDRYIEAITAAEQAGYDVLVIDSLSHAWTGKGGILEFVDRTKKNGNSFNAWGDATPLHNKLVERLLTCKLHLIVTMRTKMEFVQERDPQTGKTTIRKVGMQPVQRDGMEYEFDVICDIDQNHTLTVGKTRIDEIDGEIIEKAGEGFGRRLKGWLDGGAPAPAPVVVPVTAGVPAVRGEMDRKAAASFCVAHGKAIAAAKTWDDFNVVCDEAAEAKARLPASWRAVADGLEERAAAKHTDAEFTPAPMALEGMTWVDEQLAKQPAA